MSLVVVAMKKGKSPKTTDIYMYTSEVAIPLVKSTKKEETIVKQLSAAQFYKGKIRCRVLNS